MEVTKERLSELEDRSTGMIQSEEKTYKPLGTCGITSKN